MRGKKSADLKDILAQIPGIKTIHQVCIDMCSAFACAIREALPGAEIVIDRFHILKLLNKRLSRLKSKTHQKLNEEARKPFANIHYLLFKSYRCLQKDDKRLVKQYLTLNTQLKEVYWLCQDFRKILFCREKNRKKVSDSLMDWCQKAGKHLAHFIKTLETWWDEVVNACLFSISNGRQEGLNNSIKVIKRMAYGMTNRLHFKLRIKAFCNP